MARGLEIIRAGCFGIVEKASLGDKGNPPYPPLSGGQEKAKAPSTGGERTGGGVAFLYPPDKGG